MMVYLLYIILETLRFCLGVSFCHILVYDKEKSGEII